MGAAAAVAGQNLGAGHPERSERAVSIAARIGLGVAAFIGSLFVLIPGPLLAIFGLHDPTVVAIGSELLRYLSVSGFFITVALTYNGGLQGTGDTRSPLFITLISQVALPLGICFMLQASGRSDAGRRVDRHRARSLHAMYADGCPLQAGEVETDPSRIE